MGDNDIILIDKYLRDELTVEELTEFNAKSKKNQFAQLLTERQLLQEVIQERQREKIKSELKNLESKLSTKKSVFQLYRKYILPIAATVLLISIWWFAAPTNSNNSLFKEFYEPYPNLIDPITKGNKEGAPSAYQLYEQKKYSRAIEQFNIEDQNIDKSWYILQSHIALGKKDEAIKMLLPILKNDKHKYHQAAQWYTALLYLSLGKSDESQKLLTQIEKNKDHDFYQKFLKLQDHL